MRFDVVTLFPELIDIYTKNGIIGRAVENGLFDIGYANLRDYSEDKHKKVDDYPYGGGPGMLLKPEPMFNALDAIKKIIHILFIYHQKAVYLIKIKQKNYPAKNILSSLQGIMKA